MDLTISIVNWNVRDYLEKCLQSIFKYSKGIDLEVFVVDNASRDNSARMVREKFPQVTLIENKENIGYGSGHNQVIPLAKGRYVLFLNPDTEMLADTLPRMINFMDMHPEAGAATCTDDTAITKDNINEIIILSKFKRLAWFFCKIIYKLFPNSFTEGYCGDFIIKAMMASRGDRIFGKFRALEGGFVLIRREALKQVRGFDPKFFHGGEGWDLTRRIKKAGWKLYGVPTINIIHYGLKSIEQMSESEFKHLEAVNLNLKVWGKRRVS